MSIPAISPLALVPPPADAGAVRGRTSQATSSAARDLGAVSVDTIPAAPPPEVLEAMGVAARAADRLAADGHQMRFAVDPQTAKVVVEIRNTQGDLLWTAPPSKALEVASGGSL